jgi:hypothetical protein
MSAPDNVFSRFLLKFVEIIAAGLATAVSGYLIARLRGALLSPAPAPAVVQVAPGLGALPSPPMQSIVPGSATPSEPTLAPQQQSNAPQLTQPTRRTANITRPEPPRRQMENATSAAASTRDQESFVSRVRAALMDADANHVEPLDVSSHQSELVRAPAATAQPKPTTDSAAAGLVSAAPWSAAAVRSPPQSVSIAPSVPTTIEKSRPIVESQSPPEPPAGKETGVLSTLEQMLRQDPLAGTDQPPRPPMPVGQ